MSCSGRKAPPSRPTPRCGCWRARRRSAPPPELRRTRAPLHRIVLGARARAVSLAAAQPGGFSDAHAPPRRFRLRARLAARPGRRRAGRRRRRGRGARTYRGACRPGRGQAAGRGAALARPRARRPGPRLLHRHRLLCRDHGPRRRAAGPGGRLELAGLRHQRAGRCRPQRHPPALAQHAFLLTRRRRRSPSRTRASTSSCSISSITTRIGRAPSSTCRGSIPTPSPAPCSRRRSRAASSG